MKTLKTTLFMLMSVDGKISTGGNDNLDFDQDLPLITGIREGLSQYYDLERQTSLWSLNTGRVMKKIGVCERTVQPDKMPVSFVIIDNAPHLNLRGIEYLCAWVKNLILVTTNTLHPAYQCTCNNLHILKQDILDVHHILHILEKEYHVDELTLQSGGSLNAVFLRERLIDSLDIVVAPILIGGKDTPSLIDGLSFADQSEVEQLQPMKLCLCEALQNSYLHLRYEIIKSEEKAHELY